jgi:hypothetical protein
LLVGLDELDGETVRQMPDHAPDAGADRKRHADRRLYLGGHRRTRQRHIDDEAALHAAVRQRQHGMRHDGNETRIIARLADARILLLLLDPGQLVGELLAHCMRHIELEQEAAAHGIGDAALELAELLEIRGQPVTDLADHRHVHDHAERRHARGTAGEGPQLALRVVPVRQRIAAVDRDPDSALLEKLLDRHDWTSPEAM